MILSWLVQLKVSAIPKTVHESRLLENLDLKKLTDEEMTQIMDLSKLKGEVRYLDPSNHIGFDIFDEDNDQPIKD